VESDKELRRKGWVECGGSGWGEVGGAGCNGMGGVGWSWAVG
jgi:hypothetical protein